MTLATLAIGTGVARPDREREPLAAEGVLA